jgi:protein phosphatase
MRGLLAFKGCTPNFGAAITDDGAMTGDERALRFEAVGATDVGIARAGHANQDAFEVCRDLWAGGDLLAVVADGMGGAAAGEVASHRATEAVVRTTAAADPVATLAEAYQRANEAVRRIDAVSGPGRPGTTLVAVYFLGTRCWVASVGDSRVYRLRDGELELLTHDHSLVQDEIDAGRLTEAEARVDPRSALITRTIGGQPSVEADQTSWPLAAGDRYLACSDGLWGVLEAGAIAEVLARDGDAPREVADALIAASLQAGGPDNVTAVVVEVMADLEG